MEIAIYIVQKNEMTSEEGRTYVTYGITCKSGDQIIEKIDDISTNRGLVSKIASFFNVCKLQPRRFKPVLNVLISLDTESLQSIGMLDEICE